MTTPTYRSNELRKGRYSINNQVYLITICTHQRNPIFLDFTCAHLVRKTLRHFDQNGYTSTFANVVMPDHIHWLFALKNKQLGSVIKQMKSWVTRLHGKKIWQSGYHDRAIRKEEDIRIVSRYIVANPLRAGLTDYIGDYPYWDAV
jgi:REP element-mobilizing transposase RayT